MVDNSCSTMKMIFVTLVLLGMLIGISVITNGIQPQSQGRILVVKLQDLVHRELFVMDAEHGGNLLRLTSVGQVGNVRSPVWSPDGKQIAFGCEYNGEPNLCVIPGTGLYPAELFINPVKEPKLLLDEAMLRESDEMGLLEYYPSSVAWSPGSHRLAFAYYTKNQYRVCIVNFDKDLRCWPISVVTDEWKGDLSHEVTVDWSPTEDRLLISSESKIYSTDLNGGNAVFMTEGKKPKWAPDGEKLLYFLDGCIWIIDWDGQNAQQIYKAPWPYMHTANGNINAPRIHYFSNAVWSPDGKFIAFSGTSGVDVVDLICIINVHTGDTHSITPWRDADYRYLDWSP